MEVLHFDGAIYILKRAPYIDGVAEKSLFL